MSKKKAKRESDKTPHRETPPAKPKSSLVENAPLFLLGALAALYTAGPLVVSDAARGDHSVFFATAFAALLMAWAAISQLRVLLARKTASLYMGPVGIALAALLLCLTLSCLWVVFGQTGDAREAINTTWKWAALLLGFFLVRQLVRSTLAMRAIVSLMIGVAVLLSISGIYQYQVSMPAERAAYEANPDPILVQNRIVGLDGKAAEPGSALRQQFESRLNATEPFATFSLTNSLAGALAPWLIVVLGILLSGLRRSPRDTEGPLNDSRVQVRVGLAAVALLIGACLVLTKSRTAYLAVGGGVLLLGLYGGLLRQRLNWKIPLAIGGAAVLLGLVATLVGGLDAEVISEAPKSLLYRFEYWRSTAAMIADHPWLGVGPGGFQSNYAHYKLPQASEMIADPHNFLLEVWAIGGTFALLSLLTAGGMLAWQVSRGQRARSEDENAPADPETESQEPPTLPPPAPVSPLTPWAIYAGGFVGVVLSFPMGVLVGVPADPLMVLFGFFGAVATIAALHPWVASGRLTLAPLAIGLIVLLVNLLAAGGIGFGGVSQNVWLLTALLLNLALPYERPIKMVFNGTLIAVSCAFSAMCLCLIFLYWPILQRMAAMPDEQTMRRGPEAYAARLKEAAAADPYSPQPWQQLTMIAAMEWQNDPSDENLRRFQGAVAEYKRRDPQTYHVPAQISQSLLRMYRRSLKESMLVDALDQQRQAVALFPNSAPLHAQLAWLLHLAGNDSEAQKEAAKALSLDELHPHQEQKLSNQRIFDPAPAPSGPGLKSAEEVMREMVAADAEVA